jgi:hypothetical protein
MITCCRHTMDFESYLQYHQAISTTPITLQQAPYDNPDYYHYTNMNLTRTTRWLKVGVLLPEVVTVLQQIVKPQHWIVITEPWCGDAAHSVPFLQKMASMNTAITVTYELRDAPPHRINDYLTGQSKSIPKLIIRDADGNDVGIWGPRPAECQRLYDSLITQKADFETVKTALQTWYNKNNGVAIQNEIRSVLERIS